MKSCRCARQPSFLINNFKRIGPITSSQQQIYLLRVWPISLLVSSLSWPFAFSLSGFARGQEYLIRKVEEQVHRESQNHAE
jgi:hypothetical protein